MRVVADGVSSVWNGRDQQDLVRLQVAIGHHCSCVDNALTCAAHRMLTDQTTLDHFAFVAEKRDQFVSREWLP